jgi:hypothetical protein
MSLRKTTALILRWVANRIDPFVSVDTGMDTDADKAAKTANEILILSRFDQIGAALNGPGVAPEINC